ncbi:MAG TPA: rod shape-determining protein RodA [Candidatus Veblenbacteria bacterium]|uniref:Probable peptidoglycan glycosyltransferase FtsW n=2 Tax=Candidatus Vebleniibacteriota TaxID=1817921 RepID=A0A1G2QAV9_9BACT|nr:MAG: Rod shape-determining protein RodA [Parcubacteria group bacterium GW2011_GWD1_42_9]KKT22975.1 MAG: Rod shape-determining protein RodA [Parcubacteria group bacterium GW2011_GWE1_43_8]OHA55486.1 MAG: rod shape-determining protein RodA [Candidatus Veblenbacteria bacterium RIFOXYB1_FULL_43_13]OHA57695.1 MAG: rod shape-determining protein RodA [Candidatus Veblenbacteria bacterium RIFOXYD1_FULL_43_11]HBH17173.1 rod shape-determining protein RodA [Candidatus Veblenbacteria bacterium]
MWKKFLSLWQSWDMLLLAFTVLLLLVGLVELYSSSFSRPELTSFFNRQVVAAVIGIVAMVFFSFIDYRLYRSWSKLIYILSIVLLSAVLIFGQTLRGTTGWLRLGEVGFQPVELIKLMWVLVLASYLAYVGSPLDANKTIKATILLLPLTVLVMLQPDFGSSFMLLVVWVALLVVVPKPRRWWLVMASLFVGIGLLGSIFLRDYQQERVLNFLNPGRDPLGSGYNVTQSVIAVGSGGWWGRGLGVGTQSQLKFLPEQHTDFVFASLAEELGLAGSLIVLALWLGFFSRIWRILRRLRDDFAVLVTVGIFSLFALQVVLNIGMNLGLAPVVGITLPLVSFGGSSLLVSLIAIGILQNLAKQYSWQAPTTDIQSK